LQAVLRYGELLAANYDAHPDFFSRFRIVAGMCHFIGAKLFDA
jgi:hypothetical protein